MKKYITIIIVGITIIIFVILAIFVCGIIGGIILRGSPVNEKSIINSYSQNKQLFDDLRTSLSNYSKDLDIYSYEKKVVLTFYQYLKMLMR